MTWIPLLLADRSPCLRLLVLRELLGRRDRDPEVKELAGLRTADPLAAGLLKFQDADGSWRNPGQSGGAAGSRLRVTALALERLGFLGFGPADDCVRRGAEWMFSQQEADGSWPLHWGGGKELLSEEGEPEGYTMVPLQTALPLLGVAACGLAADPRAERAYEWLLAQRLPEGVWPSGMAGGTRASVAGYRRLPHSRWGCRSNTTGALRCLSLHPERRTSEKARQALDHLLARETKEAHTLGFGLARTLGAEPASGFFTYYARFDLALVLDLCWRMGASTEDGRVAAVVEFVRGLQGPYGLWDYGPHPEVSRWLTLYLLRSLSRLDESGDWVGTEPSTPFQAYPQRQKRF